MILYLFRPSNLLQVSRISYDIQSFDRLIACTHASIFHHTIPPTPLDPPKHVVSFRSQALSTQELLNDIIPRSSIVVQIKSMPSIGLEMCHKRFRSGERQLRLSGDGGEVGISCSAAVTTAEDGVLHCYESACPLLST